MPKMSYDEEEVLPSLKEEEKRERREKKRIPRMRVSGKGVFTLAQIIKKKVREASAAKGEK